jgi:hypothetical protein
MICSTSQGIENKSDTRRSSFPGVTNTFGAPQPGYPRGLVQTSSYLSINSIHENVAYKETAPLGKDHWIHLPSLKLVLS